MNISKFIKATTKLAVIIMAATILFMVGVYFLIPLLYKAIGYYFCPIAVLLTVCYGLGMAAIIYNFASATRSYAEKKMDSFWYK